jgi:20S proteasome alpha/beta subunit
MTLITAVQGKCHLVAACDSRGTFGHPNVAFSSHDMMEKIQLVTPHVAVLIAGAGEISDNLLDEFRRSVREPIDGVTAVVNKLQQFCMEKWNQWFVSVPFQHRPQVVYIVAGLDPTKPENPSEGYSVPRIYSLISQAGFAPAFHRYGWANIGIPIYAIYIYGRRYRSNMTIDELCGLAGYAISETATQDLRVGGNIRMVKILPEGATFLTENQIKECIDKCLNRS